MALWAVTFLKVKLSLARREFVLFLLAVVMKWRIDKFSAMEYQHNGWKRWITGRGTQLSEIVCQLRAYGNSASRSILYIELFFSLKHACWTCRGRFFFFFYVIQLKMSKDSTDIHDKRLLWMELLN